MKVNYIVANYIGENRKFEYYQNIFKNDPLFFYKKHLEFFSKHHIPDLTLTFVFNDDISSDLKEQILILAKKEYEIIFRENAGFSYGIWEHVVEKNLQEYDYFFLIEDDYIPARPDFIEQHAKKLKDNVAVVCGQINNSLSTWYFNDETPGSLDFPYPAISNCLINAEVCKEAKKTFNKIFCLNYYNDYSNGTANQIFFCLNFFKLGYQIIDILDEFSSPFYSPISNSVVFYGGDKPHLIQPII